MRNLRTASAWETARLPLSMAAWNAAGTVEPGRVQSAAVIDGGGGRHIEDSAASGELSSSSGGVVDLFEDARDTQDQSRTEGAEFGGDVLDITDMGNADRSERRRDLDDPAEYMRHWQEQQCRNSNTDDSPGSSKSGSMPGKSSSAMNSNGARPSTVAAADERPRDRPARSPRPRDVPVSPESISATAFFAMAISSRPARAPSMLPTGSDSGSGGRCSRTRAASSTTRPSVSRCRRRTFASASPPHRGRIGTNRDVTGMFLPVGSFDNHPCGT